MLVLIAFVIGHTLFTQLAFAALPSTVSQTNIFSNIDHNPSVPFNTSNYTTSTETTVLNRNLPSDPYKYRVPYPGNPGIIIEFYGYGPERLDPVNVAWVLDKALTKRRQYVRNSHELMGQDEREYEYKGVGLIVYPGDSMDWWDFGAMLKGLLHFVSAYDNVDLFFDVMAGDAQLIGTGAFIKY